jgi:hypothetical protein
MFEDVPTFRGTQVKSDRFLIAGMGLPPKGNSIYEWAPITKRITSARTFHLDDLTAEISHETTCCSSRDNGGQIQYFQAF